MSSKNTIKFNSFADLIRNTINIRGLTQYEFAQLIDKDPAQVSKWVNGGIENPSTNTLHLISEALDVEVLRLSDGYQLTYVIKGQSNREASGEEGVNDIPSESMLDKDGMEMFIEYLQQRMIQLSNEMQDISAMLEKLNSKRKD